MSFSSRTIMETGIKERFPRYCDITGEGMWEGYYIESSGMYIKGGFDFLEHITDETDYESIEDAYEDGYYYWTEWGEDDIEDNEDQLNT